MIKKIFSSSQTIPNILSVGVIIRNEHDEILLKLRKKQPDIRKWEIVAGYVESEETLKDAVKRVALKKIEVKRLRKIRFTGRYYDKVGRHPNTNCIPLIFSAKLRSRHIEETDNLRWFTKDETKKLEYALDNKKVVKNYFKDLKNGKFIDDEED